MISNNKSIVQEIVPGILVKTKVGYFFGYEHHPKDRFYILAELETEDVHGRNMLVFYGLNEERFFSRSRWFIEKSIREGIIDIVA